MAVSIYPLPTTKTDLSVCVVAGGYINRKSWLSAPSSKFGYWRNEDTYELIDENTGSLYFSAEHLLTFAKLLHERMSGIKSSDLPNRLMIVNSNITLNLLWMPINPLFPQLAECTQRIHELFRAYTSPYPQISTECRCTWLAIRGHRCEPNAYIQAIRRTLYEGKEAPKQIQTFIEPKEIAALIFSYTTYPKIPDHLQIPTPAPLPSPICLTSCL